MSTDEVLLRIRRPSIDVFPRERVSRAMYALATIAVLLVFGALGTFAKSRLGLVLPGPVIGSLLIATSLAIIERCSVRLSTGLHAASFPTTRRLLAHMGLLFVPAGVGIITEVPALRQAGTALGVGVVVSTLVGVAVTYMTIGLLARTDRSAS